MIEYLFPHNIDSRVTSRAAALLEKGGIVALPTDTSWSLVCSCASQEGLRRLKKLSGEKDDRHFTLICSGIAEISEFCNVDNRRFRLIKSLVPGPYVFILKALHSAEKSFALRRSELGVRIPDSPVALDLVAKLGLPLFSVTAKRTMRTGNAGDASPHYNDEDGFAQTTRGSADFFIPEEALFEGGWELELLDDVDLILDAGVEQQRILSTVLDLSTDEVALLRAGAGEWNG